jgi:hypothetical protein
MYRSVFGLAANVAMMGHVQGDGRQDHTNAATMATGAATNVHAGRTSHGAKNQAVTGGYNTSPWSMT